MEENERLAVLVDNAEHDVKHVAELLDKSDVEKKRLSERNAQLTVNGMNSIQLSPEGEVNSGGYIPRREASRYISTALHRPW